MALVNECPDVRDFARYSMQQAAGLLGVSRSTIYRWMESGEIEVETVLNKKRMKAKTYIYGSSLKKAWRMH